MGTRKSWQQGTVLMLQALLLTACFHPPYNNFRPDHKELKRFGTGAAVGAGVGAVVGVAAGSTGAGAVVGGLAGSLIAIRKNSTEGLIHELAAQDIQYVQYGDTRTLIVPVDRYYRFENPKFKDQCYAGLNNIARLIKRSHCLRVYVAGFTDNVGSRERKNKLSQARAETMLTFLWAKGIAADRLQADGYGDKFSLGDNQTIRGSAYNRRIEIQWIEDKKA